MRERSVWFFMRVSLEGESAQFNRNTSYLIIFLFLDKQRRGKQKPLLKLKTQSFRQISSDFLVQVLSGQRLGKGLFFQLVFEARGFAALQPDIHPGLRAHLDCGAGLSQTHLYEMRGVLYITVFWVTLLPFNGAQPSWLTWWTGDRVGSWHHDLSNLPVTTAGGRERIRDLCCGHWREILRTSLTSSKASCVILIPGWNPSPVFILATIR